MIATLACQSRGRNWDSGNCLRIFALAASQIPDSVLNNRRSSYFFLDLLLFFNIKSFLQYKNFCSTNIFMSADKISAPYAIFYTKLGKNLQKFFHWRTLRKSPARSHNKRFFLVSHCGVGGSLRSKPPKGRSPYWIVGVKD